MGNIVCFLVSILTLGIISYEECIGSHDDGPIPTPAPVLSTLAPVTSSPVEPIPDTGCGDVRTIYITTNQDSAEVGVYLLVTCLYGDTIRIETGNCPIQCGSELNCHDTPGPTIVACCEEPGSEIQVHGMVPWNAQDGITFTIDTYASDDATVRFVSEECTASTTTGSGNLPATCSMTSYLGGYVRYTFN